MDRQEQYSRRNCILIHGVKEEQNEDTDNVVVKLIKDNLEEDVDLTEFGRSHRIVKRNQMAKLDLLLSNSHDIMLDVRFFITKRS